MEVEPRPVWWVGSSRRDLKSFPRPVQALYAAQCGKEYSSVNALKGFAGRTVLEIVVPDDGNTYRAVYTVRFKEVVYVLHAFQKKSTKGVATPQREIDKVESRLKRAQEEYAVWQKTKR